MIRAFIRGIAELWGIILLVFLTVGLFLCFLLAAGALLVVPAELARSTNNLAWYLLYVVEVSIIGGVSGVLKRTRERVWDE